MKQSKMKVILFVIIYISTVTSTYAQYRSEVQSHQEFMNLEFPNKKAVFLKFGTPTYSSSFENVESWYYKIGEETNIVGKTLNFSTSTTQQNYLNPWLSDVFKQLEKTEMGVSNQTSHSKTVETYVKFWFVNELVVKWETYGVDYSRDIVRPNVTSAGEFLFFDTINQFSIHSHISKLRQLNSGINGPITFSELSNWLDNHPDFNKAFLPTIDDLKKLYCSNSKLKRSLSQGGLIVWSETLNEDDNVLCLNFKTGTVTISEKNSSNYFVPFVAIPSGDQFINMFPTESIETTFKKDNSKASGSGFFLTTGGILATNAHVVEDANRIEVSVSNEIGNFTYNAKVILVDSKNDIALIKIDDEKFKGLSSIPYGVTEKVNIGEKVFTIGYPLNYVMGTNYKVTDGIISAKSGIADDIRYYQISVPLQPGNSGGPLFDKSGNIIGITSSKLNSRAVGAEIENVNYAIKASYLTALYTMLPDSKPLISSNILSNKELQDQVKLLKNYVCLIKIF
jgi:hypothetical protein